MSELGIDSAWCLQRMSEQEIRERPRDEANEAVKKGAFGAPTIYIGDKMFWGNDRLIFVEEYFKGNI